METQSSHFEVNFEGLLPDKRLERRGEKLWEQLSATPCSSIRRFSPDNAGQRANYRFLDNERVSEQARIREATRRVAPLCVGHHVLLVEDTSEINLSANEARLKADSGLGRSDNADSGHCFKLHPALALNAVTLNPWGFADIKVFARPEERPDKRARRYKRQPIEQKESYRWIEVAERSQQTLEGAVCVTHVQDREGDIYEQFARVPDPQKGFHLLVRSRTTRKLTDGGDLYEHLGDQPVAGTYRVSLPTDRRKNQYKREAILELRYALCRLQRPDRLRSQGCPESLSLGCIWVKETDQSVENPVDWKLLTTHPIEDFSGALQLVRWYSARWYIEQVFRLLKKQGFNIEKTQLESGWAARKLAIMELSAALKILQMNIAYTQPEGGQPIGEVFAPQQVEALRLLNESLQGKTQKQKNENNPATTKWAVWIVGRLGGWKGYDSQGPPGVITLKRGLDKLNYIVEGLKLSKDVYTE